MAKKIDGRLPKKIAPGLHTYQDYSAICSPWSKLYSYRDASHFVQRFNTTMSAAIMQAFRILVPDYEERSEVMVRSAYERFEKIYNDENARKEAIDARQLHPYFCGSFSGGIFAHHGDESQGQTGRVNDCGSHRVEKEIDLCPWDFVGTEVCRATTMSVQAIYDGLAKEFEEGPMLELQMPETKTAGHLHCRFVGEDRVKYPMPEHKYWERLGPIATMDLCKDTPEGEGVYEMETLREDSCFRSIMATCEEHGAEDIYPNVGLSNAFNYIYPCIEDYIAEGKLDEKVVDHVIHCVCEAAGKAYCADEHTKEALRSWMGVPNDIDDGRVMGGFLEMYLQSGGFPYEIEAFNKNEVIYNMDLTLLIGVMEKMTRMDKAYLSFWNGMVKTLVNTQWFVWEEDSPQGKHRVKIGKKIDFFC